MCSIEFDSEFMRQYEMEWNERALNAVFFSRVLKCIEKILNV